MKSFDFKSFDNKILKCKVWDEVDNPKAVVQILHGMAEYIDRYDNFAKFLNKNGFIAFGDTHRAHGETAEELGYDKGDIFNLTVKDEIEITEYLKEKYDLPVIIFGHSYGSFLTQAYIQRNGDMIVGATLCGSANMNMVLPKIGKILCNVLYGFEKENSLSVFMDKMTFGAYNKPFKSDGEFGWLSSNRVEVDKYIEDKYCGHLMSIAFFKYFLNGISKMYSQEVLNQIPKDLPLVIISGSEDPVGLNSKAVIKLNDMYKNIGMTNVSMNLYNGYRHEILNETNNQVVYDYIVENFNSMIN